MKKHLFSSIGSSVLPVSAVLLAITLLTSCLKHTDNNTTSVPVAGLMAFNLAPDKPSVVFSLSGNSLSQLPLSYTNYTGGYQSIYTGSRNIDAYDYNLNSLITTSGQTFDSGKYYSVFLVGTNGTYRNVITTDNLDSLSSTSGQAYVRYINAIPDSSKPVVTITAGGSDVANGNASFSAVSDFKAVSPGEVKIRVSNGSSISADRTIVLEKQKIYTVLLTGIPGETDAIKSVQIKYIQNGSLSSDTKQ